MKKRRGRIWMFLGLALILAAMLLSIFNIMQERSADRSAADTLNILGEKISHNVQDAKANASGFVITDAEGNPMEWPVDAEGNPLPWPVDAEGNPLPEFIGADGSVLRWNADVAQALDWETNLQGEPIPWIRNAVQKVVAWPQDDAGELLDWNEVQTLWSGVILQPDHAAVEVADVPLFVQNPEMEMPLEKIKGNYYIGVLDFPSRNLSLPVISEWSYPRLRVAPCRYSGSVYSGDLVISGHNYSRHFGSLKNMQVGEELRFTDVDGNVFFYTVTGQELLGRRDVEKMKSGNWDLTLFTCTYGGGSRVTVRCTLTGYEPA